MTDFPLSDAQRRQLAQFARSDVALLAKDPRWFVTKELQRARLVRIIPITKGSARVVVTDAGRARLVT